jgi:hypothetical protein
VKLIDALQVHKPTLHLPLECYLTYSLDGKVSRLLDVVESLWISQALLERHFDAWFTQLIQSHHSEVRKEFIVDCLFQNFVVAK